jgi:hypothetical protein
MIFFHFLFFPTVTSFHVALFGLVDWLLELRTLFVLQIRDLCSLPTPMNRAPLSWPGIVRVAVWWGRQSKLYFVCNAPILTRICSCSMSREIGLRGEGLYAVCDPRAKCVGSRYSPTPPHNDDVGMGNGSHCSLAFLSGMCSHQQRIIAYTYTAM